MEKVLFKAMGMSFVFCIAAMLFVLNTPIISYGDDCVYEISVNVAANIVNIDSQGEGHAVVVHTNQDFSIVDRDFTTVFVDDCKILSFGQREDDNGNLDVYFLLESLKLCQDLDINSDPNTLFIDGVSTDGAFCGDASMRIVEKQGPPKR